MIIDNIIQEELAGKYRKAKNRLVLLDYDGTLVEYAPTPDKAIPSEQLINLLSRLIEKPGTELIIISGRGNKELDLLLGHLPINIVAEHGAMIKESGVWEEQVSDEGEWRNAVISVMNDVTLKCSASFVEEKNYSLAWHYRNAESKSGYAHSRELISQLDELVILYNLKILDGNKVVEIMNKNVGKGKAVKKLLAGKDYDFVLSIGDDATDEEIFEFFLTDTNSCTIKVGEGNSFAKFKFNSVSDVVKFLKYLSE